MNRFLISLFCFWMTAFSLSATPDINSLLKELDAAIDSSQYYVNKRLARIKQLNKQLAKAGNWQSRYHCLYGLYNEYKAFQNDSAIAYLDKCIITASQNGDIAKVNDCKLRLAYQSSQTGSYMEAYDIIREIDLDALDEMGKRDYLIAKHHLYHELAYYGRIPWLHTRYEKEEEELVHQLLKKLSPNDGQFQLWRLMNYYWDNDMDNALASSNSWMKMVKPGSPEYAIAAFYRFVVYSRTKNKEMMKYWLIQSALCDVHNAVMDQASLWELANLIKDDSDDPTRSYKYIRFAWYAAQTFNTKMRSGQISPVLSLIEDKYKNYIHKRNLQLAVVAVVSCILLIIVVILLIYVNRQRQYLLLMQKQLKESNDKLNELNKKLEQSNKSLNESNKMKELYIGRFLSLCSNYIDKTETLKRNIAKLLKTKEYERLTRLVEKNSEVREDFYRNFDSAFLKLFPDFVKDFNALLRPEDRMELTSEGALTVSMRIFALIRLGIEDSSKIAEFLNYSVNTIYNYRAKTKNGAIDNREEFEDKVKNISMK